MNTHGAHYLCAYYYWVLVGIASFVNEYHRIYRNNAHLNLQERGRLCIGILSRDNDLVYATPTAMCLRKKYLEEHERKSMAR